MSLTNESFDRLLAWLHPDREEAGAIYVKIRSELIRKFQAHARSLPDKLADDTLDRVAKKLEGIIDTYVGAPDPFVKRVAYYVLLEDFAKNPQLVELTDDLKLSKEHEDIEPVYDCLERCMKALPLRKRELIAKYYQGDKAIKIRIRKELALSLNLELPVLRLHARRIRVTLKKCIKDCLEEADQ